MNPSTTSDTFKICMPDNASTTITFGLKHDFSSGYHTVQGFVHVLNAQLFLIYNSSLDQENKILPDFSLLFPFYRAASPT